MFVLQLFHSDVVKEAWEVETLQLEPQKVVTKLQI
jgi:hypothetical protein